MVEAMQHPTGRCVPDIDMRCCIPIPGNNSHVPIPPRRVLNIQRPFSFSAGRQNDGHTLLLASFATPTHCFSRLVLYLIFQVQTPGRTYFLQAEHNNMYHALSWVQVRAKVFTC